MRTERFPLAVLAMSLLVLAPPAWADEPSMPNAVVTPGAVDPAATWDVICNGTTKTRRHVSAAMKAGVLAAYNIRDAESPFYEIDHLVPLAIGGANVVANLWPQPWAEAVQKDALEVELQRRVCHRLITQAEAQREVADDWTVAYARYVGGPLVAAPNHVATAAPATSGSVKAQLKAEAWRLTRRWILGEQ